ncbi:MAG: hypothetical protein WAL25_06275 [Acidimicrobiia bacterium]
MAGSKRIAIMALAILLVGLGAGAALAGGQTPDSRVDDDDGGAPSQQHPRETDPGSGQDEAAAGGDFGDNDARGYGDTADQAEDAAEGPDTPIVGPDLKRASRVALEFLGEGRVTGTELEDEESYYEIEVTLDDGTQIDVQLDEGFEVVGTD